MKTGRLSEDKKDCPTALETEQTQKKAAG